MNKKIIISLFAFSCMQAAVAATQYTPAQQSVLAASQAWQQALDAHNPKAITALFAHDTYFYPTFNDEITTREDLYQYFVNLSKKQQLKVVYDQESPRVYGDGSVGVNSGMYTFSYFDTHANHVMSVAARFTFIYLKEHGRWMIVEHHSSALPVGGL